MLKAKTNYPNLDIAKLVCALLVIVIHTSPLAQTAPEINFFLVDVLSRVAVPLFFVMSGFLLLGPMQYENGKLSATRENFYRICRYWCKTALLYGGWSLAYLLIIKIPMWYDTGWWGPYVIKDAAAAVLFVGTHYHLWYLLAVLYVVPLLYLLQRCFGEKELLLITALLWVCECLTYSYTWLGTNRIALFVWFSQKVPIIFDAIFRALPLMLLGGIAARHHQRCSAYRAGMLALTAFFICAMEVYILRAFTPNSQSFSYLIFTPFMAWWLLRFLLSAPSCGLRPYRQTMCRNMSTIIYCLHPMIIDLMSKWFKISGLALWLVVTLLSVLLAAIIASRHHIPDKKEDAP